LVGVKLKLGLVHELQVLWILEQARDLADDLLARDPESAQAHLSRWLGGRVEFINS